MKEGASTDFNPYFGTDYGICSIIKPQTAFDPKLGQYRGYKIKVTRGGSKGGCWGELTPGGGGDTPP